MDYGNLGSNCEGGQFEGKGDQKVSVSDKINGLQYTEAKSDSFVLDMEGFSHLIEKDMDIANSRITLQKKISRKGSLRGCEKKINPCTGGNERDSSMVATSPRATLHGSSMPEKQGVVTMGATNHSTNPQVHHQITITNGSMSSLATESKSGGKRFSFRRSSSWTVDPRRILLFFATLSSVGTILLIYFTLSMGKLNGGDDNALD